MFLRVGNTNGVYYSEDNCFRNVVYLFQRQSLSIYYVINNTNQIMFYTTFVMEDNWRQRKIFCCYTRGHDGRDLFLPRKC